MKRDLTENDVLQDPEGAVLAIRRARREMEAAEQRVEQFELVFSAFDQLRRNNFAAPEYSPQWKARAERAEANLSAIFNAADDVRGVAVEIIAERGRQDAKWGAPHDVANGTGTAQTLLGHTFDELARMLQAAVDRAAEMHESTMAAVLLEEVFEALAESDDAKLRAELVQVAAVAAKWVQIIDARAVAA